MFRLDEGIHNHPLFHRLVRWKGVWDVEVTEEMREAANCKEFANKVKLAA